MEKSVKKLYVFDFDETLILNKGSLYIQKQEGTILKLDRNIHKIKFEKEDKILWKEFNDISNFISVPEMVNKFLKLLQDPENYVCICTARYYKEPVELYLSDVLKLEKEIEIGTVGEKDFISNNYEYYEKLVGIRKKNWILNKIEELSPKEVYFFDDNQFNVNEVFKLRKVLDIPVKVFKVNVTKKK